MTANRWMRHAGPAAVTVLLASLGSGSASVQRAGSPGTVVNPDFGVTMPGVPGDLSGLTALSGLLWGVSSPGDVVLGV